VEGDASSESGVPVSWVEQESSVDENGAVKVWTTDSGETVIQSGAGTSMKLFKVVKSGGSGGGSSGGGGGGGGGPKKVANKRKSQTVKRYKKNDARRASA
jgi:hypothetical protein